MSGYGTAPLGTSRFGYGSLNNEQSDKPGIRLFPDEANTGSFSASNITYLGTVKLDAYGRPYGMPRVAQKVILALLTKRESSSIEDFGMPELPKTITPNFDVLATAAINLALRDLVNAEEITLHSVSVESGNNRALLHIQWSDNTSEIAYNFALSLR